MIPIPRSLAYNEVLLPSGVVSGVFATGNASSAHGAVYERPEDGAEHDPAHEDVWFHEDRELDRIAEREAGDRHGHDPPHKERRDTPAHEPLLDPAPDT